MKKLLVSTHLDFNKAFRKWIKSRNDKKNRKDLEIPCKTSKERKDLQTQSQGQLSNLLGFDDSFLF